MLESMVEFFRKLNAAPATAAEPEPVVEDVVVEQPPLDPQSELVSLLDAVREQTVALQIEQGRAASEAKRELETLTNRMTTLAPLFTKAVEAQAQNEKSLHRMAQQELVLLRRVRETQGELERYRPMALKLEDDLLNERNRLAQALRDVAEMEGKVAKSDRRIEDLFQKLSVAETEMQRTAEANAAYALKAHETEFAMEAAARELAQLKSALVGSESERERQAAELADLTSKLGSERDTASRAHTSLTALQADYDQFKKNAEAAIRDFESRERQVHEMIAQRDWQIYDYETRHAAQVSKIEFLSKKNESQRDDILRHIAHINRLEGSNRHLLDTLSRSAISIDDTADDAERGKLTPPKLRAVNPE